MRDLAQRLLTHESVAGQCAEATDPAAARVCNKLRSHLSPLMGVTGFRSLLARGLTLAKEEVPTLKAVQVTATGSLDFSSELHAPANPNSVAQQGVVLVAQLLGLLVIFIGEPLTLRLLQEIWPEVVGDLDLKEKNL